MMRIFIMDRNRELIDNIIKVKSLKPKSDKVDIIAMVGNPLNLTVDAIVSPANSFGFMDGGIDYLYTQRFGIHIQEKLQQACQERGRELLVGEAFVLSTGDPRIRWCISAPTMRVPKIIDDPIDVFLATRAAIDIAKKNGINNIAFPGMGTGVGKVPYSLAALAMVNAIYYVFSEFQMPISWREACNDHNNLRK